MKRITQAFRDDLEILRDALEDRLDRKVSQAEIGRAMLSTFIVDDLADQIEFLATEGGE